MLDTQGPKMKLITVSVVAKWLKLLPSQSPGPEVILGSVLAAPDQRSEERDTSQSDSHARLETTKDIGQGHTVGDIGEVHLRKADQAEDTGDTGAGLRSDKSVSQSCTRAKTPPSAVVEWGEHTGCPG